MIIYLAYRDERDKMIPVSHGGMLTVFSDWERADVAKGDLGVYAPTKWDRIAEICKEFGLTMPPQPKEAAVRLPGL